jgi:hypothetical protein
VRRVRDVERNYGSGPAPVRIRSGTSHSGLLNENIFSLPVGLLLASGQEL